MYARHDCFSSTMTNMKYLIIAALCCTLLLDSCHEIHGENTIGGHTWTPGIGEWEVPEDFVKQLPNYHMGYDFEGRPVLTNEFGKWDLLKFLNNKNSTYKELLYKRSEKSWYDVTQGKYNVDGGEDGSVVILDTAGFSQRQLISGEAIEYQLWNMRLGEYVQDSIAEFYIINASFLVSTWIELVRPVAGKLIGRAIIVGDNKDKLFATLAAKIPRIYLPPWYGGYQNYAPITVI